MRGFVAVEGDGHTLSENITANAVKLVTLRSIAVIIYKLLRLLTVTKKVVVPLPNAIVMKTVTQLVVVKVVNKSHTAPYLKSHLIVSLNVVL